MCWQNSGAKCQILCRHTVFVLCWASLFSLCQAAILVTYDPIGARNNRNPVLPTQLDGMGASGLSQSGFARTNVASNNKWAVGYVDGSATRFINFTLQPRFPVQLTSLTYSGQNYIGITPSSPCVKTSLDNFVKQQCQDLTIYLNLLGLGGPILLNVPLNITIAANQRVELHLHLFGTLNALLNDWYDLVSTANIPPGSGMNVFGNLLFSSSSAPFSSSSLPPSSSSAPVPSSSSSSAPLMSSSSDYSSSSELPSSSSGVPSSSSDLASSSSSSELLLSSSSAMASSSSVMASSSSAAAGLSSSSSAAGQPSTVPIITVLSAPTSISPTSSVKIYISVISGPGSSTPSSQLTYTWMEDSGSGILFANASVVRRLSPTNSPTLVLVPRVAFPFPSRTQFNFTLTVTDTFVTPAAVSSVNVAIYVNPPPTDGVCSLYPYSGNALSTTFYISCQGWWNSDNPDLVLTYRFAYILAGAEAVTSTNLLSSSTLTDSQVLLVDNDDDAFASVFLPEGYLTIFAYILDSEGSITRQRVASIQVAPHPAFIYNATSGANVLDPASVACFIFNQSNTILDPLLSGNFTVDNPPDAYRILTLLQAYTILFYNYSQQSTPYRQPGAADLPCDFTGPFLSSPVTALTSLELFVWNRLLVDLIRVIEWGLEDPQSGAPLLDLTSATLEQIASLLRALSVSPFATEVLTSESIHLISVLDPELLIPVVNELFQLPDFVQDSTDSTAWTSQSSDYLLGAASNLLQTWFGSGPGQAALNDSTLSCSNLRQLAHVIEQLQLLRVFYQLPEQDAIEALAPNFGLVTQKVFIDHQISVGDVTFPPILPQVTGNDERQFVDVSLVRLLTRNNTIGGCFSTLPTSGSPSGDTLMDSIAASLISDVFSVTIFNALNGGELPVGNLSEYITFDVVRHTTEVFDPASSPQIPSCAYWQPTQRRWSTDGCITLNVNVFNDAGLPAVRCACNHLTEFALLLHANDFQTTDITSVPALFVVYAAIYFIIAIVSFFQLLRLMSAILRDPKKKQPVSVNRNGVLPTQWNVFACCGYHMTGCCRASGIICAGLGALEYQHVLICIVAALRTLVVLWYSQEAKTLSEVDGVGLAFIVSAPYWAMFWSYSVLIFQWVVVLKSMQSLHASFDRLKPIYVVVNIVVVLAVVALFLAEGIETDHDRRKMLTIVGSSVLAAIYATTALGFIFVGGRVTVKLNKLQKKAQPSELSSGKDSKKKTPPSGKANGLTIITNSSPQTGNGSLESPMAQMIAKNRSSSQDEYLPPMKDRYEAPPSPANEFPSGTRPVVPTPRGNYSGPFSAGYRPNQKSGPYSAVSSDEASSPAPIRARRKSSPDVLNRGLQPSSSASSLPMGSPPTVPPSLNSAGSSSNLLVGSGSFQGNKPTPLAIFSPNDSHPSGGSRSALSSEPDHKITINIAPNGRDMIRPLSSATDVSGSSSSQSTPLVNMQSPASATSAISVSNPTSANANGPVRPSPNRRPRVLRPRSDAGVYRDGPGGGTVQRMSTATTVVGTPKGATTPSSHQRNSTISTFGGGDSKPAASSAKNWTKKRQDLSLRMFAATAVVGAGFIVEAILTILSVAEDDNFRENGDHHLGWFYAVDIACLIVMLGLFVSAVASRQKKPSKPTDERSGGQQAAGSTKPPTPSSATARRGQHKSSFSTSALPDKHKTTAGIPRKDTEASAHRLSGIQSSNREDSTVSVQVDGSDGETATGAKDTSPQVVELSQIDADTQNTIYESDSEEPRGRELSVVGYRGAGGPTGSDSMRERSRTASVTNSVVVLHNTAPTDNYRGRSSTVAVSSKAGPDHYRSASSGHLRKGSDHFSPRESGPVEGVQRFSISGVSPAYAPARSRASTTATRLEGVPPLPPDVRSRGYSAYQPRDRSSSSVTSPPGNARFRASSTASIGSLATSPTSVAGEPHFLVSGGLDEDGTPVPPPPPVADETDAFLEDFESELHVNGVPAGGDDEPER